MPKKLEEKLEREYPQNPHAVYGTMNKIGAMHGNKETAKGRKIEKEMECKHCSSKHHKSHEDKAKHKALEKMKK